MNILKRIHRACRLKVACLFIHEASHISSSTIATLPVSTKHQSLVTLASLHTDGGTRPLVCGPAGGRAGCTTGLIMAACWTVKGWGGERGGHWSSSLCLSSSLLSVRTNQYHNTIQLLKEIHIFVLVLIVFFSDWKAYSTDQS